MLPGYGTTNTGNVARKCFQNSEVFARALGLDENLVKRFANILMAFKMKAYEDLNKLEEYCWETYAK